MPGNIGLGELVFILAAILLLFGAKRVPEVARSLGQSIAEFKKAMRDTAVDLQTASEPETAPNLRTATQSLPADQTQPA
ncbi:twin-arginine translocase TatA/TatE family subunit [candidate division KSB1 bacterium]|nr:twin-arginine translocase TatA/TatE family subunit [candidate division KSB1 bacterium]